LATVRSERDADGGLTQALREARLAEAAHFEAALNLRDSKSIRLQLLKDDLLPAVTGNATARELFDLALIQGEPPRLWIDLISQVVMEPDHRTYRFQQDRQDNRETLFESDDRAAMAEYVRRHMAHRLIQRERQGAQQAAPLPIPAGYSTASLILAWTAGFAFGALVLLGGAIYLGQFGN
jgi:excinuclease UvrABC nuclease subunit